MQPTGRSSREAVRDGRHGARRSWLAAGVALVVCVVIIGSAAGCDTSGPGDEPTATASTAQTGSAGTTTADTMTAEGDPIATDTTTERSTTSEERPRRTTTSVTIGELGGRRNPIPVGQEAQVGSWTVEVVGAILNGTQTVLDENMFNDPPEPGSQYVLVSIEATYAGGESSTFWVDMLYELVGGDGTGFKPSDAVAPDSILDAGEVPAGGSVAGNLLFAVASDQIAGGTLMVEEAFARDDTRVYFAIR